MPNQTSIHRYMPPPDLEDMTDLELMAEIEAQGARGPQLDDEEDEGEHPEAWTVKDDRSLRRKEPDGRYDYQAIEITTPPMYFSREAIQEVLYVATVMSNTYRCALPSGLHVHVGNSTEGFSNTTIQNLVATYFTFEEVIELIHPPSRTDFFKCPSLRRGSTLMKGELESVAQPPDIKSALEYLFTDECRNIYRLWQATSSVPEEDDRWQSNRPALNLKPLANNSKMKTVEFR